MRIRETKVSNTKIAIVFFILLFLIMGISLTAKLIDVVRKSQFIDKSVFSLSISGNRNTEVIVVSYDQKNETIFKLKDINNPLDAGRLLKIPIDGYVISPSLDLNKNLPDLLIDLFIDKDKIKTNLTKIDLIKTYLFNKTIPKNSMETVVVDDTTQTDKLVTKILYDELIGKDNQTIEIFNATNVSGLGNRLARLVSNIGGNVLMVNTEIKPGKKSAIIYNKKTHTAERLHEILGYEMTEEAGNSVADISIIIGEDKVKNSPF